MDDTPDFFDPALQGDEQQRTILQFLRTLTAHYERKIIGTDAQSMALGVLLIAKGVSVKEDGRSYQTAEGVPAESALLRLTVSGLRWQKALLDGEKVDATKARGAVLSFVWSAYKENRAEKQSSPVVGAPAEKPRQEKGTFFFCKQSSASVSH